MKWLIASDIHGSAYACEKIIKAFREEKADRLLLLGDILYHGPRNQLPEGYDPMKVAEMLNGMKEKITCVRGNCDAEVDQMVLHFPIMADYCLIEDGGSTIFATHGHVYNEDRLPEPGREFIFLQGHTHLPTIEKREGYTFANPGSATFAKNGFAPGYLLLENGELIRKELI